MSSLKASGFKPLTPLTPAALDLRTGIFCCIFNGLLKSSKSSWILALELRLKQKPQRFCGVQDHLLSPAVILPLQGSGYSPALTLGDTHSDQRATSFLTKINQPKSRVATHPARNAVATLTTPQAMEMRYG